MNLELGKVGTINKSVMAGPQLTSGPGQVACRFVKGDDVGGCRQRFKIIGYQIVVAAKAVKRGDVGVQRAQAQIPKRCIPRTLLS